MKKIILIMFTIFILTISSVYAVFDDDLIVTSDTEYKVTEEGNLIIDFEICNLNFEQDTGEFLVEIQPIETGNFFPKAIISNQQVCDLTYPNNVHVVIDNLEGLSSGSEVDDNCANIHLETNPLAKGEYDIKGVSVDRCCVDSQGNSQTCNIIGPFGWGKKLATVKVTETTLEKECGDSICSSGEDADSCKEDCKQFLGDGVCSDGESSENEPACVGDFGAFLSDLIEKFKGPIVAILIILASIFLFMIIRGFRK